MHESYKDQGFTVLGLHAPEFAYERRIENVQKSVDEYGMTYPVAQDNDFATWKAFNNRYWPAFYLIDVEGNVRYTHFWEGKYDEKEQAIQELLEESAPKREEWFSSDNLRTNTAISSIDLDQVLSWWPSKDGIPAINTPEFLSIESAWELMPYMWDESLGIVLHDEQQARFYGYDVLVWHEIVNDTFAGTPVAVTFCPLCWSAIVYDRNINGREVTFWVSGKLYTSNLLMYDSHDETLWSQSLWEAVVGDQTGSQLSLVGSNLMTYKEFQDNFPSGKVLFDGTGFLRNYGVVPYGNYDSSDDLYFPAPGADDTRFSTKELFYIVNDGSESLAFHWNDLRDQWSWELRVGETLYKAEFDNGLVTVRSNDRVIPWYFEMWFSWVSHNQWNKNIWKK